MILEALATLRTNGIAEEGTRTDLAAALTAASGGGGSRGSKGVSSGSVDSSSSGNGSGCDCGRRGRGWELLYQRDLVSLAPPLQT